jgi:hypothetical protein
LSRVRRLVLGSDAEVVRAARVPVPRVRA